MTPADLKRIANTPGFGTGEAARNRATAENECLLWLPGPEQMPAFFAAPDHPGPFMPTANFGNGEDGRDWCLWHDGRDEQWHPFGEDAADDARIVAAILNAYRLGLIVPREKLDEMRAALKLLLEYTAQLCPDAEPRKRAEAALTG